MVNKIRKKILIVEDNNEDFSLLYRLLLDIGYSGSDILKFNNISDILSVPAEMLQATFINLSLIEPHPVEKLRQLQKIFVRVPLIILSKTRRLNTALSLMEEGAEDYLVKGSFTKQELEMVLLRAIARKQFFNTLDNSKTDYFRLFEDSPIPMWIYDRSTLKFLSVNAAAIDHYGFSKEEFLKMSLLDIRADEEPGAAMEIIKLPAINSFYNSGRRKHIKRNGERFYTQVYTYTIKFEGNKAGIMLAFDIDKKVLMEKQNEELHHVIRQQNEQFDNVLSSTEEVIWSCDAADFKVLYINDACFSVYGYTPGEILMDKDILANAIHPDDRKTVSDTYNLLPMVSKVSVEYRVRHRDGTLKTLITRAVLKKNKKSGQRIITGITIDVTQLRSVEHKLRDHVKEMSTILESITEGFYSVNADWNITYINREFERILDIKRTDMLGRNLWDIFPGFEDKAFYRLQVEAMREQSQRSFEEYYPEFEKWLRVNVYPAKGGLIVYLRDISDEKERLLNIEKQNELLQDISWLQSHKVRGPVATILGLTQLFNYNNPADPVNQEILEGIKFASNGLDDIIKSVVEKTTKAEIRLPQADK